MDVHISIVEDFKTACPDVEVEDWCMSAHAFVMKRKQDSPDIINPGTWRYINPDMIRAFQARYDSFLRTFDGFIVGYAACFAMIYEKYNKPIIMMNCVRYDMPFCKTKDLYMREQFHECLHRLRAKGLLTVVSNNKADQLYLEKGAGIPSLHLPSLCLYTKTQYNPTRETFLIFDGSFPSHPLLTKKSELPQPYDWSHLTQFRGIVNYPYEVSLMSVFEQFTAGCPLFFPSKTFWKSNPCIQSMAAYWGDRVPLELAYFQDLNNWIDLADMYDTFQSPNTYYFDSNEHLVELLETFEYKDDRAFRQAHIARIKDEWKRILQRIVSGKFWTQEPRHMCYNRLPLLANVVYDIDYAGTGVQPQHAYPYHDPLTRGDVVFVKTDYLQWFLENRRLNAPVTLVTGVSDLSPTKLQCSIVVNNPNVVRWIGANIPAQHPKIVKLPIGVGEPERANGDHATLQRLHAERIPWEEKETDICTPYHSASHASRTIAATLPKLPFEEYMQAISKHRFVVCMRGNGIDTHRFCEILLMGSVPVVEHSELDDMYAQFPCVIVDSLENVDVSNFTWDEAKYQWFLDVFWLRDGLKYRLL